MERENLTPNPSASLGTCPSDLGEERRRRGLKETAFGASRRRNSRRRLDAASASDDGNGHGLGMRGGGSQRPERR
jgi:hypothetical protein